MNSEVEAQTSMTPDTGPQAPVQGGPRKWVVAVALAVALGLVVMAGALWLRLGHSDGVRLVAGPNQLVNRESDPNGAHNSPTIVMSPTDSRILAVAGRVDRPGLSTSVHVSRDGGRTWSDSKLTLPAGQTRPSEAQAAFDGQGTLYVLFSTLDGQGVAPNGLWLEGSRDGGQTFSMPVKVAERFAYQPRLLTNHRSENLHVTWLQAGQAVGSEAAPSANRASTVEPAPAPGTPPNPIIMATSRDRGATFSERAQVSDPSRQRVGGATPAVAPNGDVFVMYQDYGVTDVRAFQGPVQGGVHRGTFSLVLSRSTDAGSNFSTAGVAESSVVPSERFFGLLPKFPSLAIDPRNGALYAAWSDNRNGDSDVFVRRSTDSGRTWSGPVRVDNHKDTPGEEQYLPRLSVAPNGRVDVLFLDDDGPDRTLTTAVLASSVDAGKTWAAIAVSNDVLEAGVAPAHPHGEARTEARADRGTHLGLVSTSDTAYAVWPDSRRGNAETARQDLFFAPVRVAPE